MKRITVAVDSFKGSLSSREVAEAVEQGIVAVLPDCEVRKVSIADGGEGTVEAMVENLSGEWVEVEVCDPLMRPIDISYGVVDDGRTAVMEMSCGILFPQPGIELRSMTVKALNLTTGLANNSPGNLL